MKKLIPVLAMIMLVPFVICSCFVQQAKSMKLSYEEIAEEMSLPLGTVKAQLFRAREFLYQIMKSSEHRP